MVVDITLSHGKTYIWSAQDACEVREKYRITGSLVGCLPRAPRQNIQLGLPLQLMEEETTLLIEKGFGRLVEARLEVPCEEAVEEFRQMRKFSFSQQVEASRTQRLKAVLQHKDQIIEGRKHKYEQQTESSEATRARSHEGDKEEEDVVYGSGQQSIAHTDGLLQSDLEFTPLSENSSLIQIALETPPPLKMVKPFDRSWIFPQTDHDRLRYRVFKDLWEQGYFLTAGGKFGGDFLVYPGDPLRFHSMFIARCVPFCQDMSPLDMVAMGRLASNVKKTLLLCALKDDELFFTSLQWTGIS